MTEGLRRAVDGDQAYSGLITKNPMHAHWAVQLVTPLDALYDLDELAAGLGDDMPRPAGARPAAGALIPWALAATARCSRAPATGPTARSRTTGATPTASTPPSTPRSSPATKPSRAPARQRGPRHRRQHPPLDRHQVPHVARRPRRLRSHLPDHPERPRQSPPRPDASVPLRCGSKHDEHSIGLPPHSPQRQNGP